MIVLYYFSRGQVGICYFFLILEQLLLLTYHIYNIICMTHTHTHKHTHKHDILH